MPSNNNEIVVELGRVIKERNVYVAGNRYYKDNIVEYRGAAYIADPATPDGYVTVAPWTTDRTTLNTGWRVFADGNPEYIEEVAEENIRQVNEAIAAYTPVVIEGDVTNAADEEDLTSINIGGTDVIRLKDKAYAPAAYSGLGRVYLRKNIVNGVNVLTQDMLYKGEVGSRVPNTNTIFVIRYDYDLNNDEITVPDGCVLEFEGGSLSNGTITGQNTLIRPSGDSFLDITLTGTWANNDFHVSWWKCAADGATDDGFILHSISQTISNNGKGKLIFPENAEYAVSIPTGPTDHSGRILPYHVLDFNSCVIDVEMNHSKIKVLPNLWTAYGVINFNQCPNFSLHGGKIEGDRLTRDYEHAYTDSGSCNAVYARGGNGVIYDMEMYQMPGNGLYLGNNGSEVTAVSVDVFDCKIHHVRKNGAGVAGNRHVGFRNCSFEFIGTSDNIAGIAPAAGIDFEFEGDYKYGGTLETVGCLFDTCDKNSIVFNSNNSGYEYFVIKDCRMLNAFPTLGLDGTKGPYDISGLYIQGSGIAQNSRILPSHLKNCNIKQVIDTFIVGEDVQYEDVVFTGDLSLGNTVITPYSSNAKLTFNKCGFDTIKGLLQSGSYRGGICNNNNQQNCFVFNDCLIKNSGFFIQEFSSSLVETSPYKFYGCTLDNTFFTDNDTRTLYFERCTLKNVEHRYAVIKQVILKYCILTESRDVDAETKGGYGFANNTFIADHSIIDIKQYSNSWSSSNDSVFKNCILNITENNLSKTHKITVINCDLTTNKPRSLVYEGNGYYSPSIRYGSTRPTGVAAGGTLTANDIGLMFFDNSVGVNKPIYVMAVNELGIVTWVDSTGAVV